jgi:hypothetical protein
MAIVPLSYIIDLLLACKATPPYNSLALPLAFFFFETMYVDEGSRPVGRSAAQLAVSGLTDMERTSAIKH